MWFFKKLYILLISWSPLDQVKQAHPYKVERDISGPSGLNSQKRTIQVYLNPSPFLQEKIPIWPLLILYQMDHFLTNNSVALPSGTNHDCQGWIISCKKYLNRFPSNFERTLYNALQRMVGQKLRNNFKVIDLGMSTILILLR